MLRVTVYGNKETINNLEMIERELSVGVDEILYRTAESARFKMMSNAPSKSGALLRSIDWKKGPGKNTVTVGVIRGGLGTKGSPGPETYGYYADVGNAPHMPNIEDIANRLGISTASKIGWFRAVSAARAISLKSGPAHRYFSNTVHEIEDLFYSSIYSLIGKMVK